MCVHVGLDVEEEHRCHGEVRGQFWGVSFSFKLDDQPLIPGSPTVQGQKQLLQVAIAS